MSSRALRRAQKELDEQRQLEQLARDEDSDDGSGSVDESPRSARKPGFSAFAILNEVDDGADDDDGDDGLDDDGNDDDNGDHAGKEAVPKSEDEDEEEDVSRKPTAMSPDRPHPSKAQRRKKKRKKTAHQTDSSQPPPETMDEQLDEIDSILRQLSKRATTKADPQHDVSQHGSDDERSKLLSIDTQHMHAANEMRRLFGRAAMEDDHADQGAGRRRARGHANVGIGAAVAGRRGGGNAKLAGIALRRNLFIQGKEDWPQASSGGLGMEVLDKNPSGVTTYTYVHSRSYQDVQRQFQQCVEMGDPQQMVNHLAHNPYHISTLLQVSEIARNMERDYATAGDLLERALFALGRSVHSTFGKALTQGTARLDFRRSENREFWLASWRYIENLSMRATWRTVFEWAKMLLALDPTRDPYCMRLLIDQYAIRAKQPSQLVTLCEKVIRPTFGDLTPPHLEFSCGLALVQSGESEPGRQRLKTAIERSPWIANRLFQELNLEPIPPTVWGKQPPTELDQLYSELYAVRAKDIWNTPEATSLLMSVAHTADKTAAAAATPSIGDITIDMARHIILADKRELLGLVPRQFTNQLTSSSDPLPPNDAITMYSLEPVPGNSRLSVNMTVDMTAQMERLAADIDSLGLNGLAAGDDDSDGGAAATTGTGDMIDQLAGQQGRLQRLAADIDNFMQNGGNGNVLLNFLRAYNREAPEQDADSENADDAADSRRARVEDAEDEE